jgi:hypothetical protein
MSDELLWEQIEEHWDKGWTDVPIEYKATRFIGITQALARGENWKETLGEWIEQKRQITLMPRVGTRIWDAPDAKWHNGFPQLNGGFVRLKLQCNCSGYFCSGVSAMYRRLNQEDTEEGRRLAIDENQP